MDGSQFLNDGRWAKVFMPTITHAFYNSREPFLEWTRESPVFLATTQRVFNLVFDNVSFTLSSSDPVVLAVSIATLFVISNHS